jgi:hypothetical protein
MSRLPPRCGHLCCAGKYFAWRNQPPLGKFLREFYPFPSQTDGPCLPLALSCPAEGSLSPPAYSIYSSPSLLNLTKIYNVRLLPSREEAHL